MAFAGMALFPIAPWLGGGMLALAGYASGWVWDGSSEWLEVGFFWAALLSVLGAFAGVV